MERKIIAFIPVRGGSKSIPLKNIKELCGKPLVYWCLRALSCSNIVDQIVVATDSLDIERVVDSFCFDKVSLYHRSEESASDGASTESVILEYLDSVDLDDRDIFMLVQATSPLTSSVDFEKAINFYENGAYDSLLSCVRYFRFFWSENGNPKNYDYLNRPRRQDFSGELMENGAFYINRVGSVKQARNRLSGRIGIYEMPSYTSFEIDEPDDWTILEILMYKYVLPKRIKLFLTDVDGVLTDGGMYYSENSDELKKFNTRDGMGFQILRENGIKTGIITSEDTLIVKNRAKKLKVDYLYQGKMFDGKLNAAKEICQKEGITLDEVAYVGDDINCIELLSSVGFAFCPLDASNKVLELERVRVLTRNGGEGVFREAVDFYIQLYHENFAF